MNEVNIGVMDGFTKERKTVPLGTSEKMFSELLRSIKGKTKESISSRNTLSDQVTIIFEALHSSGFCSEIACDSDKPDCSLYYYIKNVAAISVCLAVDQGIVDQKVFHNALSGYSLTETQIQKYDEDSFIALLRLAAIIHNLQKIRLLRIEIHEISDRCTQSGKIARDLLEGMNCPLFAAYAIDRIIPQLCSNLTNNAPKGMLEEVIRIAEAVSSNLDFSGSEEIGYLAFDIKRIQEYIGEADKLPMLHGGSAVVNLVLETARTIIAKRTCDECILFAGGGNLLAFIPSDESIRHALSSTIEKSVDHESKGGLDAAIVTGTVKLCDIGRQFGEELKKIQLKLEQKKQAPSNLPILKPLSMHHVCPYCNKRLREKTEEQDRCPVCERKIEVYRHTKNPDDDPSGITSGLLNDKTLGLKRPGEITDLGDSIAVITIDGNMMGNLFTSSKSPAEYSYKSETFDRRFRERVRKSIDEFVRTDCRNYPHSDRAKLSRSRICCMKEGTNGPYLALRPIYIGGDDILIITSSRAAVPLTERLITDIAEEFMRGVKRGNDFTKTEGKPVVTVSAGIAVAKSKFPIYFVIEQARNMEAMAKRAFRNACETHKDGSIILPTGSLALTAISGAMPSMRGVSFIKREFPPYQKGDNLIKDLDHLLETCLDDRYKRTITDLLSCSERQEDRINLIKSTYASAARRGPDGISGLSPHLQLEQAHFLSRMLSQEYHSVLIGGKMIIPHIWHHEEGAAP